MQVQISFRYRGQRETEWDNHCDLFNSDSCEIKAVNAFGPPLKLKPHPLDILPDLLSSADLGSSL